MSKTPLVSIIMNCFNGEKYLTESLKSIQNQNYKNWELIFWDNKSTDRSKIIFKKFKDKRFKYYYAKKFTNLYTARNLAIKKAKGKILTFLDVDDLWAQNKLLKQVDFFNKNKNAQILYSNYFNLKKYFGIHFKKLQFKKILPSGFITRELLNSYCVAWLTVALRKNLIKKKLFNEELDMVSDFDFVINASFKKKIFCIQEPLAISRKHSDQLQRRNFYLQAEHYLKWYKITKLKIKLKKLKNLNNFLDRINFFEKILTFKKENKYFKNIFEVFLNGKIKLAFKLLVFVSFPNFFIKFIASV